MDTQKALRLLFILCIFLCVKLHIYSQQLNYDKEVEILLSKMTLNEKIGQMNQLNFYEMNDELLEKVKKSETGSLLNTTDPRTVNLLQKAAMESRLGIPLLIARDVIHGYKTIFPIPLGQAASFTNSRNRSSCCCCGSFREWYQMDICSDDRYCAGCKMG